MSEDRYWCIHRPGKPITRQEWESWLTSAPGFSVTSKIWGSNPRTGKPISLMSDGAGVWERGEGKRKVYFNFQDGRLFPIDPDDETVAKLSEIAAELGAEVSKVIP